MNPLIALLPGGIKLATESLLEVFRTKQKLKLQKQEQEAAVETAVVSAKLRIAQDDASAAIAWEREALAQSGLKDEAMFLVVVLPVVACFFPGGAAVVSEGFAAINASVPVWWQAAFGATVAVSYGLRQFANITSIFGGKK